MILIDLFKGIIIGFISSIPLGPIGIMLIQKILHKGRWYGFFSALGASFADTIYAIIAAFGIGIVINFIEDYRIIFQITASVIIIFIGIRIFYSNPVKQIRSAKYKKHNLFGDIVSTFFITISNPAPLFFFIASFASFNIIHSDYDEYRISVIVLGIFLGASFWWFLLANFINVFRNNFRLRRLWWINKITGLIIFIFGLVGIIWLFFI